MKLGLHYWNYSTPSDPAEMAATLADTARVAEEAGFSGFSVMDHYFQMEHAGSAAEPMLEGYTTLGYVAARTERLSLGVLVTGVMYRHPGLLAKIVTTLDVLSGGRARLGIGASWYEREQLGLGVPVVPVAERFERLEETLEIAHRMWSGDRSPFGGKHYRLDEPINSPASVSQPRPRILIGGSGEQKTLRLVARYADASNFFINSLGETRRKLDVLKERCAEIGRPYDEIEKTAIIPEMDIGPNGERVNELVEYLGKLAEVGIQATFGAITGPEQRRGIELAGRDLIPQIRSL